MNRGTRFLSWFFARKSPPRRKQHSSNYRSFYITSSKQTVSGYYTSQNISDCCSTFFYREAGATPKNSELAVSLRITLPPSGTTLVPHSPSQPLDESQKSDSTQNHHPQPLDTRILLLPPICRPLFPPMLATRATTLPARRPEARRPPDLLRVARRR